ncbi:MAG: arsenate reductase ArsC, partial [Candidatus Eremiobacterota bacterium]
RSQMAEALARKLLPGVRVESAGLDPAPELNELAFKVMREAGLDLSGQRPKRLGEVDLAGIDTVITLGVAEASAALPPGLRVESWVLPDAGAAGDPQEMESMFRSVRDELRERLEQLAHHR